MENKIDKQLQIIKDLEDTKRKVDEQLVVEREFLKELMSGDNLDTYKSDRGTISIVNNRRIKIKNKDSFLMYLKREKMNDYIEIIPEHEEIEEKKLRDDILSGKLQDVVGVDIETTEGLRVRLN